MRKIILALILVMASTTVVQAFPICWDFEGVATGEYTSLNYTNGWFSMDLTRVDNKSFSIENLSADADASWGARSLSPVPTDYSANYFYILEFSHAVTAISLDFSDYGNDDDFVGVEGYNYSTGYLGSDFQAWPSTSSLPDFGTVSLSGVGGMDYVFFGSSASDDFPTSIYFDNICVEAVPEPGTLALFGFGLASGAAALRRRRARKA